jgi:hypothetical protein
MVYVAAVSQTAVAVALVLGICTRFAALGAVALLAVAVYSLQVVKGFWMDLEYRRLRIAGVLGDRFARRRHRGLEGPSRASSVVGCIQPPCFVAARSARSLVKLLQDPSRVASVRADKRCEQQVRWCPIQ